MVKILVVDDEADLEILIKQKFRKRIREGEFDFQFALNGRIALEIIEENPDIDLILSDINMPEMDGLTLLSKVKEKNSLLKTVIISAYGDMENIRTAMNLGAFDFITKPVDFRDLEITLDKTIQYRNQIKSTLKALRENNILKMYVDETVLNFMGNKELESSLMENETIDASVAFIDLVAFTKISENEEPNVVVGLLNEYFDLMVKEIIEEKGSVDKFIGDAIMAVFQGENHFERAIKVALSIREKMAQIPVFSEETNFKPEVSIGINSGEMVSGNIGSRSLKRLDYTVIGDTVNVAARLQTAANPGQILVLEKCVDQIKDSFTFSTIGEMKLKNKAHPVKVLQVDHINN
ncbi:MAG TPA: adenylate/guanylate cyclase domain-containing response regulator [Algoriphagus sp.]|jgi:adenylate cyclase|uniref:adenylate/guanylate cyclase domain-containing protein n=1 Tax=Algoriphagus TaxID=246875 RepID=UPI000C39E997|nr:MULTISPECIES: adenylate/guanylate cyclase domain-containing protein [Algoriphagus]MAL13796.1 adenylate/guanylate cyclase domain-containing response regulator [Algoriphagus sp.]MAN87652.1 adenylate/guanylate cyclase domain-containing response regulator [Algoriphagus sp.]QYH40831.1 response regulator [Algoriphagus sp. NBT04N3]HAH38969.1 adenylate/guanylate cyclase domain-containing response regulator [Algoriphagus sp.]HAS59436.1 adenylate/guanylate cyclase domain-containing response regulator|tara:strand:- start:3862 stop:4911 length:1050 start_codon:yes stop_codon:yes gene_type:complete